MGGLSGFEAHRSSPRRRPPRPISRPIYCQTAGRRPAGESPTGFVLKERVLQGPHEQVTLGPVVIDDAQSEIRLAVRCSRELALTGQQHRAPTERFRSLAHTRSSHDNLNKSVYSYSRRLRAPRDGLRGAQPTAQPRRSGVAGVMRLATS